MIQIINVTPRTLPSSTNTTQFLEWRCRRSNWHGKKARAFRGLDACSIKNSYDEICLRFPADAFFLPLFCIRSLFFTSICFFVVACFELYFLRSHTPLQVRKALNNNFHANTAAVPDRLDNAQASKTNS